MNSEFSKVVFCDGEYIIKHGVRFSLKHLLYPQYVIHIENFYDLINKHSKTLSKQAKKLLNKYEKEGRKGVCDSVLRHWKYIASL